MKELIAEDERKDRRPKRSELVVKMFGLWKQICSFTLALGLCWQLIPPCVGWKVLVQYKHGITITLSSIQHVPAYLQLLNFCQTC